MLDEKDNDFERLAAETEEQISADEELLLDELGIYGESRRRFLGQVSAAGIGSLGCSNQLLGRPVSTILPC